VDQHIKCAHLLMLLLLLLLLRRRRRRLLLLLLRLVCCCDQNKPSSFVEVDGASEKSPAIRTAPDDRKRTVRSRQARLV
jgi:hypothetical protein